MMAASKLILHFMWLLLMEKVAFAQLSMLEQQKSFIMANVGHPVTLTCLDKSDTMNYLYWFKQRLGDKPEMLVLWETLSDQTILSDKIKDDPRFSVATEGRSQLNISISDVRLSDSAIYNCGMMLKSDIQFKESIMLHVNGSSSSIQAIVQQPPKKSVHPGDSVTLNCTVLNAANYSCAVADEDRTMVYCLAVALVISIILVIVLSSIILWKLELFHHGGQSVGSSMSPTNTVNQDEDNLHYAALSLKKKSRPRPQRNNMQEETVYAGVRVK